MSNAASQADAFYEEVLRERTVWMVRDSDGFPAPTNAEGKRAAPFWSSRSRAERIVATVAAYAEMDVAAVALDVWRERWLPGLERDGLLVGLNWSGPRATGFDLNPLDVERNLASRQARRP